MMAAGAGVDPADDVSISVQLVEGLPYDVGANDRISVRVKDATTSAD